jgi:hypothetical protein
MQSTKRRDEQDFIDANNRKQPLLMQIAFRCWFQDNCNWFVPIKIFVGNITGEKQRRLADY